MGQNIADPGRWKSVKEMARLKPMADSCDLAYMILSAAEREIKSHLKKGMEINTPHLSKKLKKDAMEFLSRVENMQGIFLPGEVGFCYDPTIEGGDKYNLHLKTRNKDNGLKFEVFTCSIGVRLRNYYCCHFVRSSLLCYSEKMIENHKFMMLVHEKLLGSLQHGVKLCDVYETVWSFAKEKNPHLARHLETELGFQLGPNFLEESGARINLKSEHIALEDTFFATNVNLTGLEHEGMQYNLFHSDTIHVRKNEAAVALTDYNYDTIKVFS